jgi:hypothetical protein
MHKRFVTDFMGMLIPCDSINRLATVCAPSLKPSLNAAVTHSVMLNVLTAYQVWVFKPHAKPFGCIMKCKVRTMGT